MIQTHTPMVSSREHFAAAGRIPMNVGVIDDEWPWDFTCQVTVAISFPYTGQKQSIFPLPPHARMTDALTSAAIFSTRAIAAIS